MSVSADSPTSVYLYYDRRGVLLYVGVTSRGVARNVEHNTSKPWWQYVARQEVEHYPTRFEALTREKQYIRRRTPPFNKQHNPHHEELVRAYLTFGDIKFRAPSEIVHESNGRIALEFVRFDGESSAVYRTQAQHRKLATLIKLRRDVHVLSYRRAGTVGRCWQDLPYLYLTLTGKHVSEATGAYAFIDYGGGKYHLQKVMLVTASSPASAFGASDVALEVSA